MTQSHWPVMDDQQRTSRLSHAVAIAYQGGRMESQTQFSATIVYGSKPNHILHAILFVFTCFLWGIVWLIIGLTTKETRVSLMVDEYGRIYESRNASLWQHRPELERA